MSIKINHKMKVTTKFALCAFSLLTVISCKEEEPATPPIVNPDPAIVLPTKGSTMLAWEKGQMDIHFINTTMGECTFIIMPDGTQMLVDAAGSLTATGTVGSTHNTEIRSRWDPTQDANFDCGVFIENYIKKCMAWTGNNTIDYALLTHFHNDHYGAHLGRPASKNSSTYVQQSFTQIMDDMTIGKLMDRGYPDYDYPFSMRQYYKTTSESSVRNYITAVEWHVANKALKVEKFVAGSNTQIVPLYSSEYNCKVQNLCVNGEVWTGSGTSTTKTFPEKEDIVCAAPPTVGNADKCPEENHVSCAFKLSYGLFDYFGGGDLQYDGMSTFSWKDIETPVAKACGAVEVMKADHHGTSNTNGYGASGKSCLAMKYLTPQCWVANSWTDEHPRKVTFEGVTNYLPSMDCYITNTCATQKAYTNYASRFKAGDGHVVIRVYNGGAKYYVFTLTDSDEKMTVKTVNGPYSSR